MSCRMYLNKGNNHFEDITEKAGVTTNIWTTGVSVADVNNDGFDDLYICSYGKDLVHRAKNLLFINHHDLTFKEQAQEYGLADTGYSSQAVFLIMIEMVILICTWLIISLMVLTRIQYIQKM
ncbi:MAG: VCBS repeat-containing protein [Segetibacter sp.]